MGTIIIEEYSGVGSPADANAPIANLSTLEVTTVDSTTSTSAESITPQPYTRLISVTAVEAHRLAIKTDTTGAKYAYINAGERRDFGVNAGDVIYYRLDV